MYCFYLAVPPTFVNIASAIVLWKSGTTCPATLILRVLAHLGASTLARFNLLVYCDEVGYLDLVYSSSPYAIVLSRRWILLLVLQLPMRQSDVTSLLQVVFTLCVLSHEWNYIIIHYTSYVISAVSEPADLVAHQRTQHSIVVRPTAVRAISADIICQTIDQHCRTSDLELTATCCVKLRLSLSTYKARLKTHLFSTAFC